MSVLVNVRVPEHVRDTWKAEAEKLGVTLTDFVKGAVEARIDGREIILDPRPPAGSMSTDFPGRPKGRGDTITTISPESIASIARPTPTRRFTPDFKKGKGKS